MLAHTGNSATVSGDNVREERGGEEEKERGGVAFMVVKELGHHLQNHVEWERGAEAVLRWTEKL